jgi:hypothetical protein
MTIFVEAVAPASECFKATQRPSYEFVALVTGRLLGQCSMHPKVTGQDQITDQYARDTDWEVQPGRDLRDGRACDTQLDDPASRIVGRPPVWQPGLQRLNRRFQGKVDVGAGPSGGQGVRTDQVRLT